MAIPKSDRNEAVIARYRDDKKNLRDIAVEFDISHERVRQIVSRVPGLLRTNRFLRRKDVDAKTLEKLVNRGLTLGEISDKVGMAETNVRVRLASAGLKPKGVRRKAKAAA